MNPLHAAAAIALTASTANALTFQVDNTQSTILALLDAGGLLADDTSPLTGTVEIDLDDNNLPTLATLQSIDLSADEDLNMIIDLGSFGGLFRIDLTDVDAFTQPGFTPIGPVPVTPQGDAAFNLVTLGLSGGQSYEATGLLCTGLVGEGLPCQDAGDLDPSTVDIDTLNLQISPIETRSQQLRLDSTFSITLAADGGGSIQLVATLVAFADVPTTSPLTGDVDGDGTVGPDDLFILLANFGNDLPGGPSVGDIAPDGNPDGTVGPDDLFLLLANFGNSNS